MFSAASKYDEKYRTALRRNRAALEVYVGQEFKIGGRKYKVIEKYPYIIRLQARNGKTITMNQGDIIQFRTGTMPDIEEEY